MPDYITDVSPFHKWHPVKDWFLEQPPLVVASMSSVLAACDNINHRVNRSFTYVRDGINDQWQTPAEFVSKGWGDCEDYAIYKMFKLMQLGVLSQDMELVICFDKQSREYHCVLRVFAGTRQYILDNQHALLLNNDSFNARYQPIFAIGLSGWRLCEE